MTQQDNDSVRKFVRQIFRLDDVLKATANKITQPSGQSGARWQVLNALTEEPRTVAEIARLKNASRQGVQRIINDLHEETIVRSKVNPKHQRFPLYEMTPSGRQALRSIELQRKKWSASVLKKIGGTINPNVISYLERFGSIVEDILGEELK
jgi:DNA-binding MarR family transcriptional regulator